MQSAARIPSRDAAPEPVDLRRLYEEHGEFVRSVIARLLGPGADPDDLTQELFVLAWKKLPSTHAAAPRAWLCQAAVRLATNARRVSWLRRAVGIEAAGQQVDGRTPESLAQARETTREVYKALERLGEKKRTAFILFEIQGLTAPEVAEAIGCPLATVYTRLHHARRDFMALFRERLPDFELAGGRHG